MLFFLFFFIFLFHTVRYSLFHTVRYSLFHTVRYSLFHTVRYSLFHTVRYLVDQRRLGLVALKHFRIIHATYLLLLLLKKVGNARGEKCD